MKNRSHTPGSKVEDKRFFNFIATCSAATSVSPKFPPNVSTVLGESHVSQAYVLSNDTCCFLLPVPLCHREGSCWCLRENCHPAVDGSVPTGPTVKVVSVGTGQGAAALSSSPRPPSPSPETGGHAGAFPPTTLFIFT